VNTIIQYTVDALLEEAGVPANAYEAVPVARMPLRLEMVLNGQLDAASLPEPLLSAAIGRGALLLATTDTLGIDAGVLLFSKKTLDSRLEDVKRFYRAYDKAAHRINSDTDRYRDYLVREAAFPQAVRDTYRFVPYRKPTLPDTAQIGRALRWLKARQLLDLDLDAGLREADLTDIVDGRAVAEW
jgi:NitT/TauT family transport system substrate-binding protein